ncbi:PREDICTED: uncharacterized protein LOC109462574 [Branchiostoma belcheri]|uniref:Uncharacterized protein LOC109462574 n=1 Tax=Branchiostoma belcheri TaxID=7741 RepID=A0A6P4Y7H2_BRABE|nr:PREDICTED: uncharacterized protein LOC109462574 [Branchiostoma belcheri]XP_019614688.1 PREDICTED: uncharacterized protein LOC109462574 [Branchiostoma belcheri]
MKSAVLVSALLLSVSIGRTNADVCHWEGEAPFCDPGDCDIGTYVRSDNCGDGSCCWSGHKIYCCIPDIDECATNNGGCQQICTNTIGSFYCSCGEGFLLGPDRSTCFGEGYYGISCHWEGTAPFCDPGDCDIGTYVRSDNCGDGDCCVTGHKIHCCYMLEPPLWSASSEWDSHHSPDRADINTRETPDAAGAWAAAANDQDPWLMRDLGDVSVIAGIITKGRNYSPDWPWGIHDQYVTSYTISYGNANGDETFYTNADGQVTVFPANDDRDTEVYNDFGYFSGGITARFVKIHPQTWHEYISMRAKIVTDINECETNNGGCEQICTNTIGSFECSCRDGFLLAADGLTCNTAVCHWEGTAPFCDPGDCDIGTYVRSDNCGDGNCCFTGQKIYCCVAAEWLEVFSTVKGTGQTVYDAWRAGPGAIVLHNKCPVVDHWESLDILRVRVVLETNAGNAKLIFDGTNTNKFDWFSKPRLLSSPWGDLDVEPQNFFSIEGSPNLERSFYINRNWDGCPADAGWMVVADGGADGFCPWEQTPDNNVPYILFSNTGGYANFNGGGIVAADRMVIYIETAEKVLCSCPDGQSLSEDGTSCVDINECETNNGGCEQICTNTIGSFECSCRDGFLLDADGFSCLDINECETNNGGCEQICTNTIGSFECSCRDGFFLAADGLTCHTVTRTDWCVLPGRGICTSCGDPHTRMFDGTPYNFQGPCRYTFAKDCGDSSDFTVEVQHVPVGPLASVSVVREVFVLAYGEEVGIHQGRVVTVNGSPRTVSFSLAMDRILVTYYGVWVHVQLVEFCVDIYYDGIHCVKVTVTPYYWDRMCGLCGNYNGNMGDDNIMSDMITIASTWNEFGLSWLVEGEEEKSCGEGKVPGPCAGGLMTLVSNNGNCGMITDPSGPFAACHAAVPPGDFFNDCTFDMCALGGDIVGLCENLEHYALVCNDAGVFITWRSPTLCPMVCPPNSHYTTCTSLCPATCQDPNPACIGCEDTESCECDAGYVMSGQHCVPIEECGCTDPGTGQYYELGEIWVENGQRCICKENNIIVCKDCSFDIVFLLDRSSSIGPYAMYFAEKYIAYIIMCLRGLDVEVGLISYDCESRWLISQGLYTVDTSGLIPKVKASEFTGGESRTGHSIYHYICTENSRPDIPRVAVVLTDGDPTDGNLYAVYSDEARARGIELYTVAISRNDLFDFSVLEYIAGGADRVFGRFSCCDLAIKILRDVCVP